MKLKILVAAAALIVAMPAMAHAPKPLHGGRIVPAGAFHVEMATRENKVDIYLVGHDDKAVAMKGYKGVVILAGSGKSERIVLEPSEDAQSMSGKAAVVLPKQPKGVVQITPPDGKTVSARFD